MISSFEQFITEYSNKFQLNKEDVGGHIDKRIVMIDDDSYYYRKECAEAEAKGVEPRQKTIRDCRLMADLYIALQNGANYQTYLNHLVNPQDGSDPVYPHNVSCVLKEYAKDVEIANRSSRIYVDFNLSRLYNEVVGCRITNAMGVPTVYNIPIDSYPQYMLFEEYPRFDTVISVDFMQEGYNYCDLKELNMKTFPDIFSQQKMDNFVSCLYSFGKEHNIPNLDEKVKEIQSGIIDQIMVKLLACADGDLASRNFMIKWKDGEDFAIAPCFDFELIFNDAGTIDIDKMSEYIKTIMFPYLAQYMPEKLDLFMAKLQDLVESGTLDKIMVETFPVPDVTYKRKQKYIHDYIEMVEETWLSTIIGNKDIPETSL